MSRIVFELREVVQEEVTKAVNEMRPAIMENVMAWLREGLLADPDTWLVPCECEKNYPTRLTQEQVEQLKALHKAFGVRYAHNPENADCMVVFSIEPLTVEERMEWDGTVVVNDCATGAGLRKLFTQKGQVVDIVAALKANGVEIEEEK